MKRILLLCLLLAARAAPASDVSDAIESMRAGNFAEAYCILKPYAENGDPEAQYNIGWMYLNGYGLAMNDNLALEWWLRSSKQGFTDATFSIAMLYSLGDGQVAKDMDKAVDYYLLAAQDGHEDALIILRSMLTRNDRAIRGRSAVILKEYGHMLGPMYEVKVKKANVRSGPSLEDDIVKVLEQGHVLVELAHRQEWMQVGLIDTGEIVWIYQSLVQPHVLMPDDARAPS